MSAAKEALLEQLAENRRKTAELVAQLQAMQEPEEKPAPRKIRITKATVRALPVPVDRTAVYWDRDLVGFGVRVAVTGLKVFFLQLRTRSGRGIKVTLGRADRITAEQAREAAGKHHAALALGRDPAAELKAARVSEKARRAGATVAELWRAYAETVLPDLRPKSQKAYRSWYTLHISPRLGRLKLADLTAGRIREMHRELTANTGGSTANRCHAVISALLSWGEVATDRDGRRKFPDCRNCARGAVRANEEESRERELSDDELRRLLIYLDASPDQEARAVEMLLATGARRGEVLALRWLVISGVWWTIPASVSKSKKKVKKPLNQAALDVLARIERRPGRVFFNVTESRLSKWWQRARRELKLEDLHLHDLRHAAASLALNSGVALAGVSKLLGHGVASAKMTERYSHLSDAELAKASDAVAERLKMLREVEPAGSA
jgi:integrase